MASKLIVRIKGGLGNQLFSYAAARRLALVNNAELIIDNVTGFVRDKKYQRKYMLDAFNISARKVTKVERMEPFERYRRGFSKWWFRTRPFSERRYLEQEVRDFDERLLTLKIKDTLYLDGLWQSEGYFQDIENVIRNDLTIVPPKDEQNLSIASKIRDHNSIALHVRWFDAPNSLALHNTSVDYYQRAIAFMEKRFDSPQYFLFSDNPAAALTKLALPQGKVTCMSHNQGDANAYADMWLMTQCKHFIIANSTFSWWGAWLAENTEKVIVAPNMQLAGVTAWGFPGLIPNDWILK